MPNWWKNKDSNNENLWRLVIRPYDETWPVLISKKPFSYLFGNVIPILLSSVHFFWSIPLAYHFGHNNVPKSSAVALYPLQISVVHQGPICQGYEFRLLQINKLVFHPAFSLLLDHAKYLVHKLTLAAGCNARHMMLGSPSNI